MLAVSLDTLPSIISRRKLKSPARTHHISQVWARCPSEHHKVLVIYLPNRSTALTCRRTEPFGSFLLYAIVLILATHFQNFFWKLFVKSVISTSNLYWTTSSIAYLVKPFNGFEFAQMPIHRNFTYQLCKSVRNSSISMLMFCTIILPLTFCISASASLPLVRSAQ